MFSDVLDKISWDDTIARIAAVTGMPEGTVKSYLSRAKQKLGEYLKKNGYERVE